MKSRSLDNFAARLKIATTDEIGVLHITAHTLLTILNTSNALQMCYLTLRLRKLIHHERYQIVILVLPMRDDIVRLSCGRPNIKPPVDTKMIRRKLHNIMIVCGEDIELFLDNLVPLFLFHGHSSCCSDFPVCRYVNSRL